MDLSQDLQGLLQLEYLCRRTGNNLAKRYNYGLWSPIPLNNLDYISHIKLLIKEFFHLSNRLLISVKEKNTVVFGRRLCCWKTLALAWNFYKCCQLVWNFAKFLFVPTPSKGLKSFFTVIHSLFTNVQKRSPELSINLVHIH